MYNFTRFFIFALVLLSTQSICLQISAQERGDLVSATLIDEMSKSEIMGQFDILSDELGLPININVILSTDYPVDLYKVVYWTPHPVTDELIMASGLVTVPVCSPYELGIVNYNHGTVNGIDVSDLEDTEWLLLGVSLAAEGRYMAVLPDYLGYGESSCTTNHPYLISKESARDVVDMIRASKAFAQENAVIINDDLFVTGYSEGGYVAMAVSKEIQENHWEELPIKGSAPMSGPYILYLENAPAFLATYTVYAYQNIFGFANSWDEIFNPPYDEYVTAIWDECVPEDFMDDPLAGASLADIYNADFLEAIQNPDHPFNIALQENNIFDWTPIMPMEIYYCSTDEVVPYQNSTYADSVMNANGAAAVNSSDVGIGDANHVTCALFTALNAKGWFDGLWAETALPLTVWYADEDGDGFGNVAIDSMALECAQPTGFVDNALDTDDTNACETANLITCFVDADGDGFGDNTEMSIDICECPQGYAVDVVGLEEWAINAIQLYPNPTNEYLQIGFSADDTNIANAPIQLQVFDCLGRKIVNQIQPIQTGTNTIKLNISDWATGTYLLSFTNGQRQLTKKVLVY